MEGGGKQMDLDTFHQTADTERNHTASAHSAFLNILYYSSAQNHIKSYASYITHSVTFKLQYLSVTNLGWQSTLRLRHT